MSSPPPSPSAASPDLQRGLGTLQGMALNIANMVGVGPFITIPLLLASMGGPQALVGWLVAAVLVICDGLVWSELGAALPGSGGTYHFLREIFGVYRWGRLIPFLFIWQFVISGALEIASGYIGAVPYLTYVFPALPDTLAAYHVPGGVATLAAFTALLIMLSLCRRIDTIGWIGTVMAAGTVITMATVIVAGLTHFDVTLLRMPPGAFQLTPAFASGLGACMLIAIYDYLGYYNICHLGDEVVDPGRTIPRAVMGSIVLVAILYVLMNTCIIAVVPWEEAMKSQNIAATFMEHLFGRPTAVAFTFLILWTVLASTFALTLGYSRIPYAAARGGDFFPIFGEVHARDRYPVVSLLSVGCLTAVFCYFSLDVVITAAVTVRILLQFVSQIVAVHVLRTKRPDIHRPFRMALYPLPSLIALIGWLFVLATSGAFYLEAGLGVIVSGAVVFAIWQNFATRE